MKLPWRRRSEKHLFIMEIPVGTLARKTSYDCGIGDPLIVAELLGLSPVSEEVDAMEREASEYRVSALDGFVPIMSLQAALIGQTASAYQQRMSPADVSEETLRGVENVYSAIAMSGAISVLSILLDVGLITVPKEIV